MYYHNMGHSATYDVLGDVRPHLSGDQIVGGAALKGRGATSNQTGRYECQKRANFDDGWGGAAGAFGLFDVEGTVSNPPALKTTVQEEVTKRIITRNSSPDIPFDRSINPYRGCEHGCIYCFARPTHAFMGLSSGLDFESRLFAKRDAAKLLEKELSRPNYKVAPIAMGTNTDPYQPVEKERRITRSILEVLERAAHPVTIVTKSRLIVRDMDILSRMAAQNLVRVAVSVTTLDHKLSARLEPRACSPQRRLDAIRLLHDAGVPVGVMVAPVIPAITDMDLERILKAAYHAGARTAAYIMLRLPREVAPLFEAWLDVHYPDRKGKVLAHIRTVRGGKMSDSQYGRRMRGAGLEAELLNRRFKNALRRYGYDTRIRPLDRSRFIPPCRLNAGQLSLAL